MNVKEKLPVFIVSSLLVLQCILVFYTPNSKLINIISFLSPLFMIWMAFSILHFGKYCGEDLSADDEFGYADKSKEELGVF
jgi:hypothetical protein